MMEPDQRMIAAQARIISQMREQMKQKDGRIEALEARIAADNDRAHYYRLIEESCRDNPVVASEWRRFVGILRLAATEDTPGITSPVGTADRMARDAGHMWTGPTP